MSLARLFHANWFRYFTIKRNRKQLRAWIAEDGALVLIVKRGRS